MIEGFKYFRQLWIYNNTGQEYYNQYIRVNITKSQYIQPDFRDILFVDEDNTTILSRRIDSINDKTATVFVQVPYIPVGKKAIYMYYNNPSITGSNENTIELYTLDVLSNNTGWSRNGVETENVISNTNGLVLKRRPVHVFNGTNYVNVPMGSSGNFLNNPDLIEAFTVEFWLYLTKLVSDQYVFASGGQTSAKGIYGTCQNSVINIGIKKSSYNAYTTIPVETNKWMHFAIVFDKYLMYVYKNGECLQTVFYSSGGNTSTFSNLSFGTPNNQIGSYLLNGMIREFRVWSCGRTQQEIKDNMYKRMTGTEPNLAYYYPFDEGTGSVLYDKGPSKKNGTITNPVWDTTSFVESYGKYVSTVYSSGNSSITIVPSVQSVQNTNIDLKVSMSFDNGNTWTDELSIEPEKIIPPGTLFRIKADFWSSDFINTPVLNEIKIFKFAPVSVTNFDIDFTDTNEQELLFTANTKTITIQQLYSDRLTNDNYVTDSTVLPIGVLKKVTLYSYTYIPNCTIGLIDSAGNIVVSKQVQLFVGENNIDFDFVMEKEGYRLVVSSSDTLRLYSSLNKLKAVYSIQVPEYPSIYMLSKANLSSVTDENIQFYVVKAKDADVDSIKRKLEIDIKQGDNTLLFGSIISTGNMYAGVKHLGYIYSIVPKQTTISTLHPICISSSYLFDVNFDYQSMDDIANLLEVGTTLTFDVDNSANGLIINNRPATGFTVDKGQRLVRIQALDGSGNVINTMFLIYTGYTPVRFKVKHDILNYISVMPCKVSNITFSGNVNVYDLDVAVSINNGQLQFKHDSSYWFNINDIKDIVLENVGSIEFEILAKLYGKQLEISSISYDIQGTQNLFVPSYNFIEGMFEVDRYTDRIVIKNSSSSPETIKVVAYIYNNGAGQG